MPGLTLSQIASILNTTSPSDHHRTVSGFASLADATKNDLSFLGSEKYLTEFAKTQAAAVLVKAGIKLPPDHGKNVFVVDDTDLAVARLLDQFAPPVPRPPVGRHHTAIVAPSTSVGDGARIGPHVFIGDDCRIGRNCIFHAGVYIGASVDIGDDVEIFPNVVIRERISIGSRVIIHAGSILGSDGFGYRWNGKQHVKIPQIGTVIIEDDVEVGSAVCIDRAKFGATRVGKGTKIDNLVQIAHNVRIGRHCVVAAQVGIAGSVRVGDYVMFGGQAGIGDRARIEDQAIIGGQAGVLTGKLVRRGSYVWGTPARPLTDYKETYGQIVNLPKLARKVEELSERVNAKSKSE